MASIILLNDDVAIKRFPINKPLLRIGRKADSEILIDDTVVSIEHAVIESTKDPDRERGTLYCLKDLGSTNGTYVNGNKVTRALLRNGDLIRIGWNTFKFVEETAAEEEKTVRIRKSWIPGVYYAEE
ncbi:MAG: FHA domain-containing protein [bacterium]